MDEPHSESTANLPGTKESEDSHQRPRRRPWIFAALILLAVGAVILLHRRQPKEELARGKSGAASPMLMISTATAQKGDIGVYVSALGVVTPVSTVAVKSRVDGQLVKVNYQEGQPVQAKNPEA